MLIEACGVKWYKDFFKKYIKIILRCDRRVIKKYIKENMWIDKAMLQNLQFNLSKNSTEIISFIFFKYFSNKI